MNKIRIFISSVQKEFADHRQALHDYIYADPLLGKFFEPFLFELLPAFDNRTDTVYLNEVERCNIYLGLLGTEYGFETSNGLSPTELEFDHATEHHKTRLVYLSDDDNTNRHPKELEFIRKAEQTLIRRKFSDIDELKTMVYASLVQYLVEKGFIQTGPFDASFSLNASLDDIDKSAVRTFVKLARDRRGFPLNETDSVEDILTHLNLMDNGALTNAALLLFAIDPQKFFVSSEVRCTRFHGTIMEKPIQSYKVYKGRIFELVDQTVDFILYNLDYEVGTRSEHVQIPANYEIPREVVAEAVVNAIVHRDYTSQGSVQVMIFRDRVEIWNPGTLPLGWTTDKLRQMHTSVPSNPLLANPMYLAGYIERLGTGTTDMIRKSLAAGLKEPDFSQADEFRAILYRPSSSETLEIPHDAPHVTPHDAPHVTPQVQRLILAFEGTMARDELMKKLELKDRKNFMEGYVKEALILELIAMTIPDKPRSRNQKYMLTDKGDNAKHKWEKEDK